MINFTPEIITKAKTAKTVEELIAIAKDNNVELTEEEAKTYFEQLHANGAVTDDDLELVSGGGCGDTEEDSEADTGYEEGDVVRFFDGTQCSCGSKTAMVGRAPHLRYGAYLRCTDCQKIIFDHIPYDRVTKE